MKLRFCLALLTLATLTSTVYAEEPGSLQKIFRKQADVLSETSGLVKLVLSPDLIAECRGDLSDLRILDLQGREVPFLLDSSASDVTASTNELIASTVVEADQKELRKAGGGLTSLRKESFDIRLPKDFSREFNWSLIFKSSQENFVRNVQIDVLYEASSYPDFLSSASIFRLPNIPAEKLRLPLDFTEAKLIRVTLEGEGDFYVEPQIFFEKSKALPEEKRIEIPLQELSRRQEGNKTFIRIAKPAGWNFEALKLASSESAFNYHVSVFREEREHQEKIAEATLFRLGSEGTPESVELPLLTSLGNILRIEIESKNQVPDQSLAFSALMQQPSLVFPLSGPNDSKARAHLFFGGGRAFQPDYDLTPILTLLNSGSSRDGDTRQKLQNLPKARLENIVPNPAFDSKPALEFAMHAGSEIDGRMFRYVRPIRVTPSLDGLSIVPLKAEDLAVARPDLADLRVVDKQNRQWPYLLEKNQGQENLDFNIAPQPIHQGTSLYHLALKPGPLLIDHILLEVDKPFFDRSYRLIKNIGKNNEAILAQGKLVRSLGRNDPLTISFSTSLISELSLEIEDGDDEALPIKNISASINPPALYLVAPEGDYLVLSGNSDATKPQYELNQARESVLRVQGNPAQVEDLTPNPDFNDKIGPSAGKKSQQWLLWGVLIAAVLGLGIYNLKMVRKS